MYRISVNAGSKTSAKFIFDKINGPYVIFVKVEKTDRTSDSKFFNKVSQTSNTVDISNENYGANDTTKVRIEDKLTGNIVLRKEFNSNKPVFDGDNKKLPVTGGENSIWHYTLGAGLILLVAIVAVMRRKKISK